MSDNKVAVELSEDLLKRLKTYMKSNDVTIDELKKYNDGDIKEFLINAGFADVIERNKVKKYIRECTEDIIDSDLIEKLLQNMKSYNITMEDLNDYDEDDLKQTFDTFGITEVTQRNKLKRYIANKAKKSKTPVTIKKGFNASNGYTSIGIGNNQTVKAGAVSVISGVRVTGFGMEDAGFVYQSDKKDNGRQKF